MIAPLDAQAGHLNNGHALPTLNRAQAELLATRHGAAFDMRYALKAFQADVIPVLDTRVLIGDGAVSVELIKYKHLRRLVTRARTRQIRLRARAMMVFDELCDAHESNEEKRDTPFTQTDAVRMLFKRLQGHDRLLAWKRIQKTCEMQSGTSGGTDMEKRLSKVMTASYGKNGDPPSPLPTEVVPFSRLSPISGIVTTDAMRVDTKRSLHEPLRLQSLGSPTTPSMGFPESPQSRSLRGRGRGSASAMPSAHMPGDYRRPISRQMNTPSMSQLCEIFRQRLGIEAGMSTIQTVNAAARKLRIYDQEEVTVLAEHCWNEMGQPRPASEAKTVVV